MLRLDNYWYIAAAARELRDRPIRRELEGETLVLFRDGDGRAQALEDRCAHRGMALSKGKVVGGCVQCPYHGWSYDGEGRLVEVPALAASEELPSAATRRSLHVTEQDEQLWVWIGPDEPDHPPLRFPHHEEGGWSGFFMQTRFEAPVEDCLENFLDVPHTLFVHPALFRGSAQRPTVARVRCLEDSAEAEFIGESPLEGWGPRLVFPTGTRVQHTDRFLLPSISRVDYLFGEEHGFVITSQCTQRAEMVVDVTTHIAWRLPLPSFFLAPFLRWYCRRVIQQDVEVLAVQGEQIQRFGRAELHTRADLLGRHIARLRRDAVGGVRAPVPHVEEAVLRI